MDEASRDTLIERLRRVGLNRYEGAVYLGLVTDQTARVAEISRRTGVPQPKVYQALDALVEKGFCAIGSDSVNRYRPIEPEVAIGAFIGKLREEEESAKVLSSELETLLQEGVGRELWAPPIEVLKGMRQIRSFMVDQVAAAKKELLFFGKSPHIPALEIAQAISDRSKEGVPIKSVVDPEYLAGAKQKSELAEQVELYRHLEHVEIREIDTLPTKLLIVDRKVAMLSISRSGGESFLVLVLRHEGYVNHVLASFELHWERARPTV